MRLGTVIGRVTLSEGIPAARGARWLIVNPWPREAYGRPAGSARPLSKEPSLVVYDNLGAGVGEVIGFVEGREASMPFDQPTAVDAINAALVDEVFFSPLK